MAQADQSRFKSTIIGPSFARAPEPVRAQPPPEPAVIERPIALVRRADEVKDGTLATRAGAAHSLVTEAVTLPLEPDARLCMLNGAASQQARAYRLLRHRLLAQGDPRVIAVSSAEPGEGKTTCAANLALALADETFARVLLVEANLKRPAFAPLFGYAPAPSFVDRLVQFRDATPPYRVAGVTGTRLHLAGLPAPAAPGARLDRLLLGVVLTDLRNAYDYIVIDAASVLESADADVAGECADGVLLVARTQKTRRGALERAIAELRPSRVLGTVLLDS